MLEFLDRVIRLDQMMTTKNFFKVILVEEKRTNSARDGWNMQNMICQS